jgi:ABC-type transport system involved in Fe-S cluster assembly fused permease/ATPase subunit
MPPDTFSSADLKPVSFTSLKRFLPYLWPAGETMLKLRIVVALLLVVVSTLIQFLGAPFALQAAIDGMTRHGQAAATPITLILLLVLGYAAARFGATFFDNLRNTVFERVGQDATRRLAATVFRHLHQLSLRFHLSRRTGAVTKVIERGTKSIDTMLYFLLFNIAPTVLQLAIVLAIFLTKFGGVLVLATLLMVVGYIWFTRIVTDWRSALRTRMNDLDTGAMAHAVDSLLNFETVKYFNAEQREAHRYEGAMIAYANAATRSENSLAWLNIGQALITNAMLGFGLSYVVWGWSQGRFTAGQVVFVQLQLTQLFRPLDLLGMVYRTIRQGLIDMAAMFDLIDTPTEVVDMPDAPPLHIERGHVRFENVHFAYDRERPILSGVDLDVPAGSTLAIVGPSGAGKSTIARLLFRFYDLGAGRITVDGQDIAAVQQASLRAAIGIVPQDTVLFNDTIGYNIAYGREGAGPEDIRVAAHGAAIDNFIASLPKGYESEVGERGLKLSGGEKQRVAIARTLLKNPPILILDEATSALDSRTEAEILDTLDAVTARRTTIIIAHRLSTIADADQIVVLEQGRIVERGDHARLMAAGGLYAEMWERQAAEREASEVLAAE